MSNLLLTQGNWADSGNQSPPTRVVWNSAEYKWTFNIAQGITQSPYLKLLAVPQVGDRVHGKVTISSVTAPGTNLYFVVYDSDNMEILFSEKIYDYATGPIDRFFTFNVEAREHVWVGVSESATSFVAMVNHGQPPTGTLTLFANEGSGTDSENPDTYSLKAFFSYAAFADNDAFEVSPLGELSAYARTFAKDRYLYGSGTNNQPTGSSVDVTVFSSVKADRSKVPVPLPYSTFMLEMNRWCYSQSVGGNFTSDPDSFRQAILAEFVDRIEDVEVGPMVMQTTNVYLPEWVIMYFLPDGIQATGWDPDEREYLERSRVKVWFSNAAFTSQYDEYEYAFVAPVDNLDDFFLAPDQVAVRINAMSMQEKIIRSQQAAGTTPYTLLRAENFPYHAPNDDTFQYPSDWLFLIWGKAGDNIDAMKENLANWILDNSTHTRDEWAEVLPDIFTSTEFIIVPLWNQYAIPNETLQEGVYSPTVNVARAMTIAHGMCTGTGYSESHIDRVMAVLGTPYKSIAMIAVGGPQNRDGINRFERRWPDYIAVSTSSIDFNRMQPETQQWIMELYHMLQVAEEMTEFSDIPITMTRLKRTNNQGRQVLYLAKTYQNVQYLVAARSSLNQLYPIQASVPLQLTCGGAAGVTSMPSAVVGQPYAATFIALGGVAPFVYELDPVLPVGVEAQNIDPVTGLYQASFTLAGQKTIAVSVTDETGTKITVNFTVYVVDQAIAIDPVDTDIVIPPANGLSLTQQFTATGGVAPYTYAAYSANLVSGGINSTTGEFSGSFTNTPTNSLRIRVTDSVGTVYDKFYTVHLTPVD